MKSKHLLAGVFLSALLFAFLSVGHAASRDQVTKSPRKTIHKSFSTAESIKGSDWWSGVQDRIKAQEYHITRQTKSPPLLDKEAYQAPNRSQNLRTYFTSKGIKVISRTASAPSWHVGLTLSGLGRGENMVSLPEDKAPQVVGSRIEFHRGDVVEWYENRPDGLEQGFTLTSRVNGNGPLQIHLDLSGNVKPVLAKDGRTLNLFNPKDEKVLQYGSLKAFDARDRTLSSHFEINENHLIIVVDDRHAHYPIVVDPLMTTPGWIAEGNLDFANFGYAVSTAGDVNGDGFSDVIVGADGFDTSGNEGKVFVYYGSDTGLSTTADWTAVSNQSSPTYFGTSVDTAGDVNGDGYSDIIIAADFYDNGGDNVDGGKVFVYYGSATGLGPNGTPLNADWTAESIQNESYFGWEVSTAGDVNNDGYDDIVVGAFNYGISGAGGAFVYHGSSTGLDNGDRPTGTPFNADWSGEGWQSDLHFGNSVDTVGDFNGDGYSDVIVGGPGLDGGKGIAVVFSGSGTGLSDSHWDTISTQADSRFGNVVRSAGDVNGDGYSDIIVGAYLYDNGQTDEGAAFVFHGSASGDFNFATPDWSAENNLANSWFGTAVGTAGDVNGDGYSDVIVGAPGTEYGLAGWAYVYYGSASGLSTTADWTQAGGNTGDNFGFDVSTAGDVNGDGYSDVIVGANTVSNGQPYEGAAYVYYGAGSGAAVIDGIIWHTFMGSYADDGSARMDVDDSGNIYVVGNSHASWGEPINPYTGGVDAFVAKLDSDGTLLWMTFIGGWGDDFVYAIDVDGTGNVYIAGVSDDGWGSPTNSYSGAHDAFAAKLNSSGALLWNTFIGTSWGEFGFAIAVDDNYVYVAGDADVNWGSPVDPHAGGDDGFAAKLNSSTGAYIWHTFMGSSSSDGPFGLAVDGSGNVYISGRSYATWGSPLNPHAGDRDAFVLKLDSNGSRLWNTFLGSAFDDQDEDIAVDSSGNVYVIGECDATWGSPLNPHSGDRDGSVAKLNSDGALLWNTFLGSAAKDEVESLAVNGAGNLYIAGESAATWGSPVNPHAGGDDAFVAILNSSGAQLWHTFMGSALGDEADGIAVDGSGNVYTSGDSAATWGSPLNPHAGFDDVFVAKLNLDSLPPSINEPPSAPSTVSPADESSFEASQGIGLEASAFNDPESDDHIQTVWKAWRADNGEPVYEETSSTDLTQHTIPAGSMDTGLRYTWQVRYKDAEDNFSSWSPESAFKVGTLESESLPSILSGSEMNDFTMISFVHWPEDPDATKVLNITYNTHLYKFGTYDPLTGGYIEYGSSPEIEPGRAYWVLAKEGLNINYNGIPVSLTTDIDVELKYNPGTGNGWNMIACPNAANYLWADVQVVVDGTAYDMSDPMVDTLIDKRLWRWNSGSYYPDTTLMEKYQGYWVNAKQANVYLRFPVSAQAGRSNTKMMLADLSVKAKKWLSQWILTPRAAIADAGDSPPMPMGALSADTQGGGGGCFIDVGLMTVLP